MIIKERALTPPYTGCWTTLEGPRTIERITAADPKNVLRGVPYDTPKLFGIWVNGTERIYGRDGHGQETPV